MRSIAVIAMLALCSQTPAQERGDEQRIAELIEQLKDDSLRDTAFHQLVDLGQSTTAALRERIVKGELDPEYFRLLSEITPESDEEADATFSVLFGYLTKTPTRIMPELCHALNSVAVFLPGAEEEDVHMQIATALKSRMVDEFIEGADEEILGEIGREYVRSMHIRNPPFVNAGSSVEALIATLQDRTTTQMRIYRNELAARLLGSKGTRARSALPYLLRILELPIRNNTGNVPVGNGEVYVRFRVGLESYNTFAQAIVSIDPDGPEAAQAHAYLLKHGDSFKRHESVIALQRLGQAAEVAVNALVSAATDPEAIGTIRFESITALGMIGPAAKAAIPTLEKLTEHEDPQVAERAKAALRQIRR